MGKAFEKLIEMMSKKSGKNRSELISRRTRVGKMLCRAGVGNSKDLVRIRALPRRTWDEEDIEELARQLTQILKRPEGQQVLWPRQALAIIEAVERRGLVGPIKCGGGKTLVVFLLITVFDAQRPVVLVPDSHYSKKPNEALGKTERALLEAAEHWRISKVPVILGYKLLGRASEENRLEEERPDLLIPDEAHALSNPEGAAVTKRVGRYLKAHPECVFTPLSGTLAGTEIRRYQHLSDWALHEGSPVPRDRREAEQWEDALQPEDPRNKRMSIGLGALECFGSTRDKAAKGFNKWVYDTPGFVGTRDIGCGASIEISSWKPRLPSKLREIIKEVQATRTRPDGVELFDAQYTSCLSQLALGFWYCWDPLPPEEWLAARREWWKFVREQLERDEPGMDTEKQVRLKYPERYAAWREVEKTFRLNKVTIWETKKIVRAAEKWASNDGVVWTHFRAFGKAIKLPYYGRDGLDEKGRHVETAKGPICASIKSCGTGMNIQWHHHRALITTLPAKLKLWEQLISRHHREGQLKDVVYLKINQTTTYHKDVLRRVRFTADKTTRSGDEQRLTRATWV